MNSVNAPINQSGGAVTSRSLLNRLLRPQSIAIVGASPTPGSLGESVLRNLERAEFSGDLYLINPKRAEIRGRSCFSSIDQLPEGIDCAVLAIPRASISEALRACAQRGMGAAIIFSAGFAETGPEGRAEQERLAQIARQHNMIIEGPNCLGMVNGIDGIPLTFVLTPPAKLKGSRGLAVVSQSGAMAAVLGVSLRRHGLDISFSISTGNEAVTGVEDYIEYLMDDEQTHVIAMIVELFRQPGRFLELAQRARKHGKHIVLLHPGRSVAARESAATHTGAMAGDYDLMRTKVAHAGVVVVDTLEELIDVSQILIRCPSTPSSGAAVLTESGAFKALTLDFCENLGLSLPPLSSKTADNLRQVLPDFIPPTNPLDITAQGLTDPDLYRRTLPPILNDEQYGSLVLGIILTDESTSALKFPPILDALQTLSPQKPVIFAALDEGAEIERNYIERLRALGVPFFPSPERAFRALARLTQSAGQSDREELPAVPQNFQLRLPNGVLPEYKSKEVLRAVGIPLPASGFARTLEEARSIARQIGYPVVLKAQSADLSHKSDVGGVVLNLADPDALTAGWERLHKGIQEALPGLALDGVLVEQMAKKGIELIAGARQDPDWGPVLLIGFGGVLAEALHDVRLLPPDLTLDAIISELYQLKSADLLRGFRGSPASDVKAAAEIVQSLGNLMRSAPAILEIDVNPVVVYPEGEGAVALDALILTGTVNP